MARSALTGSRIRERRLMVRLKQAELAERAGISPSYLNLIEHNRRRIAGKLLSDIAAILEVDPSALTEGAEAALIATLREAASGGAARPDDGRAELDRVDEFAGRFPGWAGLLADQSRRVTSLERTVETLTDRLTHDPFLSAALHDILTTITAIRSTSAILVDTAEIEPEWRDRFQRNINEDSQRLANSTKSLVDFLDGVDDIDASVTSPQEELEAFLTARGFHFAELEGDGEADLDALIDAPELSSASARAVARAHLETYRVDARAMPMGAVRDALGAIGGARGGATAGAPVLDVMALAARLGTDLIALFRRLASLPAEVTGAEIGLASCDASGTLIARKPLAGFPLPRFGAACPLWPLFQALSQPMVPIRAELSQAGRGEGVFTAYAVASPLGQPGFGALPRYEAAMLVMPSQSAADAPGVQPVGISCRICPRDGCAARREPSILSQGL